ncbi:putative lipoprotein [Pectobacterium atrosepticum SCRI1043]|uniref:Lipoprotein n=1 Tax=Pectobacterium atrosepticum (strain SCRI 1043 / ATCC BAA-672) TaxID=218491 RepID=Q6CYK0_PECAS|nr:hypothetical protein [Pectobacterium atrosepticum]GKV87947.1 hypothetical protein PEC301296_42580 [Pectobacterium carotovorum subsp. carotovorum]AIA73259.1 hypothetical protein EV46_22435 [Pectobacterium atrosepticum]AIK16289.1 putative lipoprotein [Pectobacterium atrosepticum]ATY92924.1 hypothetical protein CVS35_22505 [Pectobacterium atrosepticum]KFX17462.1 lipoprotein [Pectobacterium atrosepticum]
MKKQIIFAALVSVLMLMTGCAERTVPVANVTQSIAGQHTTEQVKNAIIKAGQKSQWAMSQAYVGVIDGRLVQRSHVANVRITYSQTSYSISYVGSENLLAGGGKIHRNYNNWIKTLDHEIQLTLAGQQIK